jgi:hypothetical protein
MAAAEQAREAWVRIPTQAEAIAGAAGRGDDHPYSLGFVPAMGRLLGAHPRIGAAFQALYGEIMFAPGRMTRAEREMVAGVAAAAQFCHY